MALLAVAVSAGPDGTPLPTDETGAFP
uniref:Uncharacterized protein n=1 Tax=Caenorhabditis japonica TaxID=281687 RepID=A0A8R1ITV7_CAEJA